MIYKMLGGMEINFVDLGDDSYMDDILANQILREHGRECKNGICLSEVISTPKIDIEHKSRPLDENYERERISEQLGLSEEDYAEFGKDEYEND